MLDDYNYLQQFEIVTNLSLYNKILTKVPARNLKPKNNKVKRLIMVGDHYYLPFVFVHQLLQSMAIDSQIVIGEEIKASKNSLIISNFKGKSSWQSLKKHQQPQFINDLMTILDIAKLTDQHGLTTNFFEDSRKALSVALQATKTWQHDVILTENLPKQIALFCLGKNLLFFSSNQFEAISLAFAYYGQSLAKNVAFNQTINDLTHQSALGWLAQPIEKQWSIFDLVSKLDSKSTRQNFARKNRFLSGLMPASKIHFLKGKTLLEQSFYGLLLAQFSSLYLASLNKVNPNKQQFLEKFV